MPPVIVTCLRSGGEYTAEHVLRLRRQCATYAPNVPMVCFSDVAVPGVYRIPLRHDWPGWWAKLEVFRCLGRALYIDLDTTIVGDLLPLIEATGRHTFIALRDFNPGTRDMGSGLMGWSGDMRHLYAEFAADAERHMAECSNPRWWGDQGFIEPRTEGRAHWQDVLPGAVVSHKKHCAGGVPKEARVVCFHGKPKPWEIGQ